MMVVSKFTLKDVRCFEGAQEFNIRPLTFLVGENSTGKSTILGCMQALGDFVVSRPRRDSHLDFNKSPYRMGAYADIARKSIHNRNKSKFDLGFEIGTKKITAKILATLIERKSGSEPTVQQLKIEFDEGLIVFKTKDQNEATAARFIKDSRPRITLRNGKPVYTFTITSGEASGEVCLKMLRNYVRNIPFSKQQNNQESEFMTFLRKIISNSDNKSSYHRHKHKLFLQELDFNFESFAPIRSAPSRTYDPVRATEDPEGKGMPMTLVNMYRNDQARWQDMQKQLVKFGKASGLFTDIEIKKHGEAVNDPFQLHVKVKGTKTNIVDVGHGVSQILPILVRIVNESRATYFLVQQPEVHLHPRGQAALVTLMRNMNKKRNHSFIVETHSDAMINRARIEIVNKKLNPDDVSLIYLEPYRNKVNVHNISFDEQANMSSNVPGTYRQFFLKEEDELLGFLD